jgi:putative salt-induced outer membrane protein YdiY
MMEPTTRRTATSLTQILLAALLCAPAAAAQEPPAEAAPPDRWRAIIDFGLTAAAGNEQIVVLTGGSRLTHLVKDDFEFELNGAVRYGRSEGREVARNYRAGLKADVQPGAVVVPFVFATAEHDPFRRLDLRANGGAGAKRVLLRRPGTELNLSLAALYSYENFRVTPGTESARFEQNARWSWRVKGDHELPGGVRLQNVTFYQPVWDRARDYLIEAQSAVRTRIFERLSLTLTHQYQRDSTPPQDDVRKDDHLVKMGLSVEF